ncbi:hypothetical protein BC831DRAFT_396115 [Entophlyctis helioformis]|nr:hypothetical protein BC831DRAFT_396115 [Entophlyctis helioformis]
MNSVLQCLFAIRPLMSYFADARRYARDINRNSGTRGQLAKGEWFWRRVAMDTGSSGRVVAPSALKRQIEKLAPQFAGYDQHDAQEFMRFLLDGLHEDVNRGCATRYTYRDADFDALPDDQKSIVAWNRYIGFNRSTVFDIFGGQLQSTVTCTVCAYRSVTFDAFWDLSLPVASRSGVPLTTLGECLDAHFASEHLDDGYKCDRCGVMRRVVKELLVARLPPVLTLHFKRFKVSAYSGQPESKIDTPISYPLARLTLAPYTSPISPVSPASPVTYDLVAVSHHSGTLGGGHYTATTRSFDNDRWYDKNDSTASETTRLAKTAACGRRLRISCSTVHPPVLMMIVIVI